MKIFINKGFDSNVAKLFILKNGKERIICPEKSNDYIELEPNLGDEISVFLKSFDTTKQKVCTFVYDREYHTCYISPTTYWKMWEVANYKILPYFSMFFLILKPAIQSTCFDGFCAGMVVITALSLFLYKVCKLIPFVQKLMYKVVLW